MNWHDVGMAFGGASGILLGQWLWRWWANRRRRSLFARTHRVLKELRYRIRFGVLRRDTNEQ